jgi:prepilin-type N-terminal cleavage/methylation domain-containing protein
MPKRAEFKRRLGKRRGFSLLEAVAAVAVVGMTAVGALSAAGSELRTAARARRALEVEALATARLDFMSLLYDADLQSLPDSVAKGTFDKPLGEYSWTATSAAYSDQAGVYDVRVTIKWTDGEYTERTYMYRRPATATRR